MDEELCDDGDDGVDRGGDDGGGDDGVEDAAAAPPAPGWKPPPGLHLLATPIGRLRDLTLYGRDLLAGVDAIACEDTRVTGRLLHLHGLTPRRLIRYDDHDGARRRPQILALLAEGASVALVSDAGTPTISDPGYKLARAAIEAGVEVRAAPGASAIMAALMVAGLPTDRFLFHGFPPPKTKARRDAFAEAARVRATLVFYESGPRLAACLADLAAVLGPRAACVCRELTKRHEETRRGALPDLAAAYADAPAPRGEIVIVVGPPDADADAVGADAVADGALDEALTSALATASLRDAVDAVTANSGAPRKAVYRRALALARPRGA